MLKVLVWNEYDHERKEECVREIYPEGIHKAIADFLQCEDIQVKTATLDDPDCGISKEILDDTDVLIWWGHRRHPDVPDEIAFLIRDAVLEGMGAVFLHSAHHSKPFRFLMGTSCNLSWREDGDRERLWVCNPSHPIMQGIDRYLELEHEETYAEPFDIPEPEELLMIGSYSGSEVFRSACCYRRGNGKIFYFQPGHESFPTFYQPGVQTIIRNAVKWVAPTYRAPLECPKIVKIED